MASFLSLALVPLLLPGSTAAQELSQHVPMGDGTRLAVDVYLPEYATLEDPLPVLLELTRYWRSSESLNGALPIDALQALDREFLEAGYVLLKVDVRGSGASFGSRSAEYGIQEVRDGHDLMEWVVAQPWCDGNLGAYGTSYSGTTAELLCAVQHPALKAVIPGWSDFDLYVSPARPYGMYAERLIDTWGSLVGSLDRNQGARLGASVRRVQGDQDGALLRAAVLEHGSNLDVAVGVLGAEYRDQGLRPGGDSYLEASPLNWKREIEASKVPMLVLASWMDAGTVAGSLVRWRHFSNPQHLVLLAGSHGGALHASPYVVSNRPLAPRPSQKEQFQMRLEFFDHHLRGEQNGVKDWAPIRYFNLGEEKFLESETWPPAGSSRERLYCAESKQLLPAPSEASGQDTYAVDFGVTTGSASRWDTQLGTPVLHLDRREVMDERMLCYTGPLLETDLQISGTAVVTLRLRSDRSDGAFLVYLEDVAPDGQSRYLTEGGLRGLQRRETADPLPQDHLPYHSFKEEDAWPLVPGEDFELRFQLQPIAVRVAKGHRIRMAIAGADRGNLERLPAQGEHNFSLSYGAERPSFIELPVVR